MEKFTNWRDKATGISPFIPVSNSHSSNRTGYKKYLALVLYKIPIAILKFPFFVILSLLILSSGYISNTLQAIFIRVYLGIVCNLWSPILSSLRAKERKFLQTSNSGKIIVVNFSSFIDPLICKVISPNCEFLINDMNHMGHVVKLSLYQMVLLSISIPPGSQQQQHSIPAENYSPANGTKTVWYFPEATTTNNKSILKFEIPSTIATQVTGTMTMMKSSWIITVIPMSIGQLIWLQIGNSGIIEPLKLNIKVAANVEQQGKIRDSLAANRLKLVNLTVKDKVSFIRAYQDRNKY